jgi:hypothetical protein
VAGLLAAPSLILAALADFGVIRAGFIGHVINAISYVFFSAQLYIGWVGSLVWVAVGWTGCLGRAMSWSLEAPARLPLSYTHTSVPNRHVRMHQAFGAPLFRLGAPVLNGASSSPRVHPEAPPYSPSAISATVVLPTNADAVAAELLGHTGRLQGALLRVVVWGRGVGTLGVLEVRLFTW